MSSRVAKKKKTNVFVHKTILVVNTGSDKKRFIFQRLSKLGVKLVVLNKEKNWAHPYVDHWILADTTSHREAMGAVREFLEKRPKMTIDGVLTFWEDDVLLTSKIADRLDLPSIPYDVAKQIRDKHAFRSRCKELGLPSIGFQLVKEESDLKAVARDLVFPLVVKPVFGASSALVMKVENLEELRQSFRFIRENVSANVESALSNGSDIMVEEYIEGDEVDIDIIIQNGKIKFYSISDNDKTNEPFFIETGQSIPSNLPDADQKDLFELADELLEKFGVRDGCIHFEAKSTSNGPVPIEVNLRMGGDEVYSFVKQCWGVDLIEQAVLVAMGSYIPRIDKPEEPLAYLAGRYFLPEHSGVIVNLDIDPRLEEDETIEEVNIFKETGDTVLVPPTGWEYLGWMIAKGESLLEAWDNLERGLKYVTYHVAKFDPASSIGRSARKNAFSSSSVGFQDITRGAKIEKLRQMSIKDQRKLHIGVACNSFEAGAGAVEEELASVGRNIQETLNGIGYKVSYFDFNSLSKTLKELQESDVDLVFNVCERINQSSLLEPNSAAILDVLQIPYTGSNPLTLSLCIDKIRVKKLLEYHDIPTPKWDYVHTLNDAIRTDLKYPLIVKPANSDNSIGITNDSVVTNAQELKKQLESIIVGIGRPALIEEYIEGDEYDVSILGSGSDDLRVLPLSRSIFKKMPAGYWHIYPFTSKFAHDPIYKRIIVERPPKKISKKLSALITEIAIDTYNILDCHDYGRVEIRVDKNNNPFVLELNPNPSVNIGDCVPSVAEISGMTYGDFLEEIIRMAVNRYKNYPPYFHLQARNL